MKKKTDLDPFSRYDFQTSAYLDWWAESAVCLGRFLRQPPDPTPFSSHSPSHLIVLGSYLSRAIYVSFWDSCPTKTPSEVSLKPLLGFVTPWRPGSRPYRRKKVEKVECTEGSSLGLPTSNTWQVHLPPPSKRERKQSRHNGLVHFKLDIATSA